ncbi:MAG TPA: efflux RND transporter permease subunit, partial [Candidatus Brocadiia bacterium]|nr:efflux RND transporter permease subunit [Candidatus Brocadiia bacterium]
MFLSNASLRRPVAMSCLIIALAFLGMNAYRKIGLELMPRIDVPFVTIQTTYPGATPSDIEVDVAKRIEDAVSSVDGLKHVTSSCMENVCLTQVEFELGVDVNVAAMDVREKLDAILDDFPEGVEKPVVKKFDVNAKAVATLALTGDLSVEDLYDYADNALKDRLSVIRGVANVEILGGAAREVHVLLNRRTLWSAGLTSTDAARAISAGILSLPSGRVRENGSEYSVRFDADYADVAAIGELQVAGRDGARRHLRDLGRVIMSSDEPRQSAFINGKPCVGVRVVKKADANAVEVVNRVRAAVEAMRPHLPGGVEMVWVTDDGEFIQASVDSATTSIWQGVLLTAAVLFFFLYSFRTTFVVAITMPLTVVVSFFFIQGLGYTLNTSTLLALGLSVGVLVTNSIVVMESVAGHLAHTADTWKAAREGAAEVAVAVLASAGTNVVVLFPIATMGSMVGLFFRPFAVTTLVVNVVSLFVSFTLTPILCALIVKAHGGEGSLLGRLERGWNAALRGVSGRYAGLLRFVGRRRWMVALALGGAMVLFVHALTLGKKIGFNFVDEADRGEVFVQLEFPTRVSLAESARRAREVEGMLQDLPALKKVFTTVGKVEGVAGKSSEGVHLCQMLLKFADKTERKEGIKQMLQVIRDRLSGYPDCIVTASIPSLVGGQDLPVDVEMVGEDLPVMPVDHPLTFFGPYEEFAGSGKEIGFPLLRDQGNSAYMRDTGDPKTTEGGQIEWGYYETDNPRLCHPRDIL